MLGVADPFMLAPTSGARFLGGLVILEMLAILELLEPLEKLERLVQPREPEASETKCRRSRARKGLRPRLTSKIV